MANRRSLALRRDGANAGLRPSVYLKRLTGELVDVSGIASGLSAYTVLSPTSQVRTVVADGGPGDPFYGFQRVAGALNGTSIANGVFYPLGTVSVAAVVPGQTYGFGCAVRRNGAAWPANVNLQIRFEWVNSSGTTVGTSNSATWAPGTDWTYVQHAAVAPAGAVMVRGAITAWSTSGGSATVVTFDAGDFGWWDGTARPQEGSFDSSLKSDFVYIPEELLDPDQAVKIVAEDTGYTSARVSFDPMSVPVDLTLGSPTQISLVRSPSGYPVTTLDGIELGRYPYAPPADGGWISLPDQDLAPGSWHYYSVFAKYESSGNTIWLRMGGASLLLPYPYRMGDWMWERIPEWYRRQDGGSSNEIGVLRKIIMLAGYEFDLHRTWCATVGDVWDVEKVSAKLLPALGYIVDQPAEFAAGDKRYRNVLSNIVFYRKSKGTDAGIEDFLTALSGYQTLSYAGPNQLLTVDDSEFRGGTGQWGGDGSGNDTFARVAGDAGVGGPSAAEWMLRVTANNTTSHTQVFVSPPSQLVADLAKNTPVIGGHSYRISFLRKSTVSGAMQVRIQWLDGVGNVPISTSTVAAGTVTTGWTRNIMTTAAVAPAQAKFARIIIERTAATTTSGLQTMIARIMMADLAWRPEGVPGSQNLVPFSGTNPGHYDDVGYYEAARMVHVNVYPQRINLALNTNFSLDNLPADAWTVSDRPTLRLMPLAYTDYDNLAAVEDDYDDLAADLDPLVATWSITFDTVGKRLQITPRASAPHTAQVSSTFFPLVTGTPVSAAFLAWATVAGTKFGMRVAWFTEDTLAAPVLDPVTGRPAVSHTEQFSMSTDPMRYELRNAVPPATASFGRLIIETSNLTTNYTAYVAKALIENAPVPGPYFDGDNTEGAFGDHFFSGIPHQSPSVYYMNFRSYINGVGGSDRMSSVMKELLPPGRDFSILHAGNGLYT